MSAARSGLGRRVRPSDALALALVAATFAVGALAYGAVPENVVVHYAPPGTVYYGVETLPKEVGLFVVPAVTAATFAVVRALPLVDDLAEELAPVRPLYQAGLVALVALLGATQVFLVLLNVA